MAVLLECLAKLVGVKDLHGRLLVDRVLEMKMVDEGRLARLISQYWELPLVDVSSPYRRFLVHFSRPVDDLLQHDLVHGAELARSRGAVDYIAKPFDAEDMTSVIGKYCPVL